MERSIGPMASPIAAMVVIAVVLATACTAGPEAASRTSGSTTRGSTPPAPSLAASSAGASASPSPTALLVWNPASLEEDWPAPVRAEPAGGATVVPIATAPKGRYEDPAGDAASEAFPWVDIRVVSFCRNYACPMILVSEPPDVDPTEQWIAYGIVVDDDGDGVADRRFGIDNVPGPEAVQGHHRAWITDLHTGKTVSAVRDSDSPPVVGDTFLNTSYPVAAPVTEPTKSAPCDSTNGPPVPNRDVGLAAAQFGLGGDTTGGLRGAYPTFFYAWASVIVDGQLLATDYAPDAGWLHPSSNAPASTPDADASAAALPIDSLEEAIGAIVVKHAWFYGFQPSDTQVPGRSSWLEAEERGDGWDVTFVCGPETLQARTTFGECPAAGCKRVYTRLHVSRDGTVGPSCEWPEGEEAAGCQ